MAMASGGVTPALVLDAEDDPRYITRFSGGLLLTGAVLSAFIVLVLGIGVEGLSARHFVSVLTSSLLAALLGGYFLLTPRPAPLPLLCLLPSLGVLMVTIPMLITHAATPAGALLLTWPVLFAGYLLPRRVAWGTLIVTLAAFGWVAISRSIAAPLRSWLELAVSADITLVVVLRLRRRAERLRAALAQLAGTDPLTGLANRRIFDAALAAEVERHRRDGRPLALLALDIDHFKQINDRWGHPTGDATLRALGALLIRRVRPYDTVGRLGGEEFGVLIVDSTADQAAARADELLAVIREESRHWTVPITLSVGVAAVPGPGGLSGTTADLGEELLAAADAALYRAKAEGRDRVRVSGGGGRWGGSPGRGEVPNQSAD